MTRIFSILVVLAIVFISLNSVLGISIMGWNAAGKEHAQIDDRLSKIERQKRPANDPELVAARQAWDTSRAKTESMKRRFSIHLLCGVGAALFTVLVNSISVTYFVGTSRWVKEVVETYQLDQNFITRSNVIKRQSFPWAVAGMLTVVAIVALGGASDPSNRLANSEMWTMVHFAGAFLGLGFIGWSFFQQYSRMLANYALINTVLIEVARVRQERGLLDDVLPGPTGA